MRRRTSRWCSSARTASPPRTPRSSDSGQRARARGEALREIPAYLQHADVVIVPHLVNPFTESLDPIKAYECLAAGRPTVTTPVAGFRHLGPPVVVAEEGRFVAATLSALSGASPPGTPPGPAQADVPSWHERAVAMASVMDRARQGASGEPDRPHPPARRRDRRKVGACTASIELDVVSSFGGTRPRSGGPRPPFLLRGPSPKASDR